MDFEAEREAKAHPGIMVESSACTSLHVYYDITRHGQYPDTSMLAIHSVIEASTLGILL